MSDEWLAIWTDGHDGPMVEVLRVWCWSEVGCAPAGHAWCWTDSTPAEFTVFCSDDIWGHCSWSAQCQPPRMGRASALFIASLRCWHGELPAITPHESLAIRWGAVRVEDQVGSLMHAFRAQGARGLPLPCQ